MIPAIRRAILSDIPHMVALSAQKRISYEKAKPIFWKRAPDADKVHKEHLESLIFKDGIISLVYPKSDAVLGFIIGSLIKAPPVYNPGGRVCMIDDFVVKEPSLWREVGSELLKAMNVEANNHNAVLSLVVCGAHDKRKKEMLRALGYGATSEWYTLPFAKPQADKKSNKP